MKKKTSDDAEMQRLPVDLRLVVDGQIELIVTHLHDSAAYIQVDARCRRCAQSLTTRQIPVEALADAELGGTVDAKVARAHLDACR